ncbi:MAG: DNA transposition protein [Thalassobium sp.]|nr:MAG: DNA transposition protein [Thalassobium sp.]
MTINSIAGITNVALCNMTLERAMNRAHSLPGIVVFHGPSGYGKSFAASYAANRHRAYFVQCKSTWTRKAFLQAIAKDMGLSPAGTLSELTDQVCEELMLSGRPLIIDEADYLADKNRIFMVMDLYEGSQAPIMLIGEERLPQKLKAYEKIDNRILEWAPAQPCKPHDVRELAKIYARGINIDDALLENLHAATNGVTRRICVNLDSIENFARNEGTDTVTLANYDRPFFTGQAPRGRAA